MKSERASKINDAISQSAQALLASLSTSYGPRGLDKMMIRDGKSIITNDGATILEYYKTHPVHKILSGMCTTQDVNCGDGTTSVVILACSLLGKLSPLRERGIHPSVIVVALEAAKKIAVEYIDGIKTKVDVTEFMNVALTSLGSKIASRSHKLAQAAMDALSYVSRKDVRVVKRVGGTIDDTEIYHSILLDSKEEIPEGKHKLLVIQFCLSAPKTNIDSKIIIDDYALMEKFVREERDYVLNQIKKIKQSGATLVVVQKSLLRESCSELAKHFLKKHGIHVVDGVDRKDVEYLTKALGVKAASDASFIDVPLELSVKRTMGMVELVGHGCTIVVGGCDQLVVDEAERSLNDVLGVIETLHRDPSIVPGGCSVETGIAMMLEKSTGPNSLITSEIAAGFLNMPYFLAQNAGIDSIAIISQLKENITLNHNLGISLRSGHISDMVNDEKVIQPAAVSKSMVILAIETVQMLLRIDDILPAIQ